VRIGSLFSGIGGLELGLERAGLGQTVWQVEQDPFCRKVLARHWPEAVRFEDVRRVGDHNLPRVDLICGGFPCQPFSHASRGRRTAVDSWPEMFRVVCDLRPRFVVAENVQPAPIEFAAWQLARHGWTCGVICLPAAVVGAPHERERWFLVGDSHPDSKSAQPVNAEVAVLPTLPGGIPWAAVPNHLGVDDGVPNRMDRLRALGNAVVPQCAEVIGRLVGQMVTAPNRSR
jgi:DNA (cytosine-5)-methyltransferase 1